MAPANRFSQYNEDSYRLPEGMKRVAYDADSQSYLFRDRSGQLYQSAPGEEYGVLHPVSAPQPRRRNVTIKEHHDPALRRHWSEKPAKTFSDILPSGYITTAQSGEPTSILSPTSMIFSSEKLVQAAMPKVQGVVDVMKRRATLRYPGSRGHGITRSESLADEKTRLLEDEPWEIIRKDDLYDGRLARSKSEMRPSRYSRK